MAPVLIPKPVVLTPNAAATLAPYGRITRHGDLPLMVAAIAGILGATFFWGVVLWMVQDTVSDHAPWPLVIALAIYVTGVVITELKEAV